MCGFEENVQTPDFLANKRAMLGSLGGGQINKKHKNGGGQSKSFKNDNNR